MTPRVVRIALVSISIILLIVGLVATTTSDAGEIAAGEVYSTETGDPIDVVAEPGDVPGTICANVGGFFYGSSISCFTIEDADRTGSYVLVIPQSRRKGPLVVGVMPEGEVAAMASVERATIPARTRSRWFLISLEPGSLGPNNANRVRVDFE